MQVLEKIRLSDEQVETLETGGIVNIPASRKEFEEFIAETNYTAEYHNEQIIVMGLAAFIHELLVGRLIYLLTGHYLGKPFYVAGSNAGIRKDKKGIITAMCWSLKASLFIRANPDQYSPIPI